MAMSKRERDKQRERRERSAAAWREAGRDAVDAEVAAAGMPSPEEVAATWREARADAAAAYRRMVADGLLDPSELPEGDLDESEPSPSLPFTAWRRRGSHPWTPLGDFATEGEAVRAVVADRDYPPEAPVGRW
jgi:hypothetical protein